MWAVEFRCEESRRRLQNCVRPLPFFQFLLERLDPISVSCRGAGSDAAIDVGLADPRTHRPELGSNGLRRAVLLAGLGSA